MDAKICDEYDKCVMYDACLQAAGHRNRACRFHATSAVATSYPRIDPMYLAPACRRTPATFTHQLPLRDPGLVAEFRLGSGASRPNMCAYSYGARQQREGGCGPPFGVVVPTALIAGARWR